MIINTSASVLFCFVLGLFFSLLQFPAQASALTYTGALDPQNPNDVFLVPLNLAATSN